MRGIIGKKIGMTQLFDEETGGVTPVTVIEAGPCPVVAVRTPDADGYEAVQLAWEPGADRQISRPERGPPAKNRGSGAYRHPVAFRGHFADAERNLLLIKGAVPGPKNGIVEIREMSK